MKSIPFTKESVELFRSAAIALGMVEHHGIKIDTDYLEKTLTRNARKIKHKQGLLESSEVMKAWRKRFKGKTNINSTEQLGVTLFEEMGFQVEGDTKTATGRHKTDEDVLAKIKHPFVADYLEIKRLDYGSRFLKGIKKEVCDGFLHPHFNLNQAVSGRSNSQSPNFQNFPNRDPILRNMVRRCFIARKGRRLIELDYEKAEVKCSCSYHKDPALIKYETDPTTDMHKDASAELFFLPKDKIQKDLRQAGKNQFVFPQFYGAYWLDCARGLWEYVRSIKTEDGILIHDWLKKKGIKRLGDQNREGGSPKPGTFEAHVQKVERAFWEERFPVYAQWRKDHYAKYLKTGYCTSLSGFVFQGFMVKNEVNNFPIQALAFHCLLWSLERLVNHEIKKNGMKALIIGQVHDSLICDVPEEEVEDFISLARRVMTVDLHKHWPFLVVPMKVDAEVSPLEGAWVEKSKEWTDSSVE